MSLTRIIRAVKNRFGAANELIVFGEVGLTGEIRPVSCGQERLYEAHKLGFTRAIIPLPNNPKKAMADFEVMAVTSLQQALVFLR